jgi:V-type H+-transporting ATPase subunit C
VERQVLELDPTAEFTVTSQRRETSFDQYITDWSWDEAKYPRSRPVMDLLAGLMSAVSKLDEECRNKLAQYNELKAQKGAISKKDAVNLTGRDLVDVLTPKVVSEDSFVYSEYLTTAIVILPKGADKEFLKCYERLAENVVPQSAKKFEGLDDKDGNSLWRVVMFRTAAENFKKRCREKRFVVRDFEYSAAESDKLNVQRAKVDADLDRQSTSIKQLYKAVWSDLIISWVHIKAMRVFVEGALRFGMSRFVSYSLRPATSQQVAARKALAAGIGKLVVVGGPFGQDQGKKVADAEEGEEYFPYVSFAFTPFATWTGRKP